MKKIHSLKSYIHSLKSQILEIILQMSFKMLVFIVIVQYIGFVEYFF